MKFKMKGFNGKESIDTVGLQYSINAETVVRLKESNLELLGKEIEELLKNKWIYMKNKNVYYNTELIALFPDLNTFVIGHCLVRNEFDDRSLKLKFGEYEGRIITHKELLSILDEDGTVQNMQFYDYTVFLNGIRWVDKDERDAARNFGSNYPHLAYNIPIYELTKVENRQDVNGYDLKYYDQRSVFENLGDIINLWLNNGLIPKGLSVESEQAYRMLLG